MCDLVKKKPDDKTLLILRDKVRDRLKQSRENEKRFDVTNPIQSSVDLMALDGPELDKWLRIFRKFDKKGVGGITVDSVFEEIEETSTSFARSIFTNVDAVDPDTGLVECADFMRAVSTFCFFGKSEILRLVILKSFTWTLLINDFNIIVCFSLCFTGHCINLQILTMLGKSVTCSLSSC